MQSDTGLQMVWEFIAVFKKHSDTTTDALVLCFQFNSGQETWILKKKKWQIYKLKK